MRSVIQTTILYFCAFTSVLLAWYILGEGGLDYFLIFISGLFVGFGLSHLIVWVMENDRKTP